MRGSQSTDRPGFPLGGWVYSSTASISPINLVELYYSVSQDFSRRGVARGQTPVRYRRVSRARLEGGSTYGFWTNSRLFVCARTTTTLGHIFLSSHLARSPFFPRCLFISSLFLVSLPSSRPRPRIARTHADTDLPAGSGGSLQLFSYYWLRRVACVLQHKTLPVAISSNGWLAG